MRLMNIYHAKGVDRADSALVVSRRAANGLQTFCLEPFKQSLWMGIQIDEF